MHSKYIYKEMFIVTMSTYKGIWKRCLLVLILHLILNQDWEIPESKGTFKLFNANYIVYSEYESVQIHVMVYIVQIFS